MDMQTSIRALMDGAAIKRIDNAIRDVVSNILDTRTSPDKPRKVIMTLIIKADANRETAEVAVDVSTKLAALRPVTTDVSLGVDADGNAYCYEMYTSFVDQDTGEIMTGWAAAREEVG